MSHQARYLGQQALTRLRFFFGDARKVAFLLGALGWILIYRNYPFDWGIPEYAAY